MKKIYILVALIAFVGSLHAQTFVKTDAQLRNVVLEEYTGIHCQYCPEGHALSQAIQDSVPTRVVLINIHQGSFSVASGSEPDFRTTFGDALAGQTGLSGYPSGTVNRHLFQGTSVTAIGRGGWRDAANVILPLPSPVNVGFNSQFDSVTRLLTITVEAYYTGNSPQAINYLHVALTQNHIIGIQQNTTTLLSNYDHKHALRHLLTGQWGDSIATTTQGSFFTKTYTYTVPANYNNIPCDVNNCDISVFISENHQEIYTGVSAPAINGSTDGTTALYIGSITSSPMILEGTPSVLSTFNGSITSQLSQTDDFTVNMVTDAPGDWTSSFSINGTNYTSNGTVNLAHGVSANLTINVTPGATPAFANYSLLLQSVSQPQAQAQMLQVSMISGITDLIVEGSGSWGDGGTHDYSTIYPAAMAATGCTSYGVTSATNMVRGITGNVMNNVKNMYFDIGWRFPSFTDDEATSIISFMNNGGNVFVAGQDIAWDIMSGTGYGTVTTKNLFTNYLHAGYSADGSSANNQLTPNSSDPIFGIVATSPIVDYYGGGNIYPDQLTTAAQGVAVLYYNSTASKIAALRYTNSTYKIVYLAPGLEMLTNTTAQNNIIKQTYDWFNGTISSFDVTDLKSYINVYPNPASDHIKVAFETDESTDIIIEISDILGNKLIKKEIKNRNSFNQDFDVRNFAGGIYFVRISQGSATKTYKVNIAR